jgi:hypothetical protein
MNGVRKIIEIILQLSQDHSHLYPRKDGPWRSTMAVAQMGPQNAHAGPYFER